MIIDMNVFMARNWVIVRIIAHTRERRVMIISRQGYHHAGWAAWIRNGETVETPGRQSP